ncbi:hypothetical protein [Streptomyces lanatus]|uniref:Uncharacterized protein n=1 Tax=Streptomyces lanatus TaxID=66900 RepID=A0ABV1XL50_9ACTN|nr:hypothetical protein [Streptomyces lanatus]GHG97363.1 hypothetical protein GCM10018780_22640 [Streptomyces lanatus]
MSDRKKNQAGNDRKVTPWSHYETAAQRAKSRDAEPEPVKDVTDSVSRLISWGFRRS